MSSKSKSTAQPAHPSTEEPDLAHACNDGWITLGQLVVDPETGEERGSTRFTSAASARSKARA
jgi:hypothetical protein